jgi:hypothetical protein
MLFACTCKKCDNICLNTYSYYSLMIIDKGLSDSELIAIIARILHEHGQATIGKLGSLLQSYTDNHNLSQFIKERHGGLKRFCEKASHVFVIGADHQYNPTVSLLHLLQ